MRLDAFVAQMQSSERTKLAEAIERQNVAELERAHIAARIKQAREEAGLSQPEMAEALGVIPRTYQNYESLSKPRTPWALMGQIATITGKTTEWLIHGKAENDPFASSQLERIEAELGKLNARMAALLAAQDLPDPSTDDLDEAQATVEDADKLTAEQPLEDEAEPGDDLAEES